MEAISVVIPTFDGAKYIGEALQSVLSQSILPSEIIVVDDASSDGTPAVVLAIAKSSAIPIRFYRQARNSGGPAAPMNVGIRLAQNNYIATLDQDDRMSSAKLECALHLLQQYPESALVFGKEMPFDSTNGMQPYPADLYACFPTTASCLSSQTVLDILLGIGYRMGGASGMVLRKDAWQSVHGFNHRLRICWDYDFVMRLALRGWSICYAATIFHYHRLHPTNLATTDGGMRVFCEQQRVLLDVLFNPHLSPSLQELLVSKLSQQLIQLGSYEHQLGHYRDSVRAYLTAIRLRKGIRSAIRGLFSLALSLAGRFLDEFLFDTKAACS